MALAGIYTNKTLTPIVINLLENKYDFNNDINICYCYHYNVKNVTNYNIRYTASSLFNKYFTCNFDDIKYYCLVQVNEITSELNKYTPHFRILLSTSRYEYDNRV